MRKEDSRRLVSLVIPVHNEARGIGWLHGELLRNIEKLPYAFEIVYIDDGSKDESLAALQKLKANSQAQLEVIELSRNFGKEAALSAGLAAVHGDAAIALDADGQHPVEYIGQFLEKWEKGADVVVGIRSSNQKEGFVKKFGSKLFYSAFNKITGSEMVPKSTDYRLMDRKVINEFNKLRETNRITRGLVDWLGFKRDFIHFDAKARQFGEAAYTFNKLVQLAVNTFISLSAVPLFISGYVGIFFMLLGLAGALFTLVEQVILSDPLSLGISGTAMLGLLIIFLVGMILSAQGLIGLYISRVLSESQGRPLYIVRSTKHIK